VTFTPGNDDAQPHHTILGPSYEQIQQNNNSELLLVSSFEDSMITSDDDSDHWMKGTSLSQKFRGGA
jgi:hypothetical protein